MCRAPFRSRPGSILTWLPEKLSAAIICVITKEQKWKYNRTSTSLISQTSVSVLQFRFRAHANTSASKSDWFAERATQMSVKKIYYNPRAGSLKASDLRGNKFVWGKKKTKKKRWQIKACKCSYFLYATRQKELMSHCAVPQITPREKNSSPQTAECGGSSPSGGVVLRLIGLCGIQWTWLRPSTRRVRRLPHWRSADTLGEYSSTAIFVVFLLAPFLEVSLPTQLQMAFTLQRHASLVPTLVAYSKSAGIIYSITVFRFSQSQI